MDFAKRNAAGGAVGRMLAGARLGPVPGAQTSARAKRDAEEKQRLSNAQFLGRETVVQRDMPPFWSVASHGQPFNDVRLTMGAGAMWKIDGPCDPSNEKPPKDLGPASAGLEKLRRSLQSGEWMGADATGKVSKKGTGKLTEEDREGVLRQMPPHHMIHALRVNFDRDHESKDFRPWTQAVKPEYDRELWRQNKERVITMALQDVERAMLQHVRRRVEDRCRKARAPFTNDRDVLRRVFRLVDSDRTGRVSLQQFLQVWQNVLHLKRRDPATGQDRPMIISRNAAAAIFVKYGFDAEGLLPYDIFINALTLSPARLLGHEVILDNDSEGKNGLSSASDVALAMGGAKLQYPKSKTGTFPPSGFDPKTAARSQMGPKATMFLEHVYGYEGNDNLANNLFYNHKSEIVYYVAGVGVVFNKEAHLAGRRSQRFFFGHSNDIQCLAQHPNRRLFASGQQAGVRTGSKDSSGETEGGRPYVCIWDSETMNLVQRIDHGRGMRSVVACAFSGNRYPGGGALANSTGRGGAAPKEGGVLVTVTTDNKHTVHVWRWWPAGHGAVSGDGSLNEGSVLLHRAHYIPGWYWAPEKKVDGLAAAGTYYLSGPHEEEGHSWGERRREMADDEKERDAHLGKYVQGNEVTWKSSLDEVSGKERVLEHAAICKSHPRAKAGLLGPDGGMRQNYVPTGNKTGDDDVVLGKTRDGSAELIGVCGGFNGTPPAVHGTVWNPFRELDGGPGSEFLTYGPKTLKTYFCTTGAHGELTFVPSVAQFGAQSGIRAPTIKCAVWVRAQYRGASPGDSCIVTGFSDGNIGVWVPPFPTQPGMPYTLSKVVSAHQPGKKLGANQDGEAIYAGCSVLELRDDGVLISGGGDGVLKLWELRGTPKGRGIMLQPKASGKQRFVLSEGGAEASVEGLPILSGLASNPEPNGKDDFVAGTNQQDIWEVDEDPQILVEGHTGSTDSCAVHPTDPNIFATVDKEGLCYLWDARLRCLRRCAKLDAFKGDSIAFSNDEFPADSMLPHWRPGGKQGGQGYHLAVGSERGRLVILDAETLQPIVTQKRCRQAIRDIAYTPGGVKEKYLAAAGADLVVDIYNPLRQYQHVSRCFGPSASIEHLDWSLPIDQPELAKLKGRCVLMTHDANTEVLFFDPKTGRKIGQNQRDTRWATRHGPFGFDVMGIWPDNSDRTDINSVDRSVRGAPYLLEHPETDGVAGGQMVAKEPLPKHCADGLSGCGYMVAGDDYSFVRLFNYPVVWDDAPCRVFKGHSSHVVYVRFSCNDRHVFSAGSRDQCIMQWRTVGVAAGRKGEVRDEEIAEDDDLLLAVDALIQRAEQDHPLLSSWTPTAEGEMFKKLAGRASQEGTPKGGWAPEPEPVPAPAAQVVASPPGREADAGHHAEFEVGEDGGDFDEAPVEAVGEDSEIASEVGDEA